MVQQRFGTAILSAIGVGIFYMLDLPLPFLFGSITACLIGALAGVKLADWGQISAAARTIVGAAVGASVTPQFLGQLSEVAASVALVPIFLLLIAIVGVPYFVVICRYDRVTAWYAAMPGGIQDMVIFGGQAGGKVRSISLIHATRLLVTITLVPAVMIYFFDTSLSQTVGAPAASLPVFEMVVMALAAITGWKVGERIGLFGASILGPLILTAILSLTGVINSRPPAEAILTAQFFIGMGIGTSYVGITIMELRRDVFSGFGYVFFLMGMALIFTWLVTALGLGKADEALLAFSPGGQAEMSVLAIVTGADLGYVVSHHLTRIILVIIGAPIAARLFIGPHVKRQE